MVMRSTHAATKGGSATMEVSERSLPVMGFPPGCRPLPASGRCRSVFSCGPYFATENECDAVSFATNPTNGSVTMARPPLTSARRRNPRQASVSMATFSKYQSLPVFQALPSFQLYRHVGLPPHRFKGTHALVKSRSGVAAMP